MLISNRRFPSILALLVSVGVFLTAAFANAGVDLSEVGSMRAALQKELSRTHPKKSARKVVRKKSKPGKAANVAKVKNKKSKRSLQASKKKGNRVIASINKKSSRRSR